MKMPISYKNHRRPRSWPSCLARTLLWLGVACCLVQASAAADFTVTTPGFFFAINGNSPNPTITLVRGKTYTFAVNTSSIHPFQIKSAGVQNNGINSGTITYTVPTVASNYNYWCVVHTTTMQGQIITVDPPPPPPPTIKLLSLAVSTNVVLVSTGTNTWTVDPQYSTNLSATNWYALTVITNNYLNGTNETICGRPPGDNVFIRISSQPK